MDHAEMKIQALMRLCEDMGGPEWEELRQECVKYLEMRRQRFDPEREVRKIFLELGAPDHLTGHPYAVRAIVLVMYEQELLQRLSQELYPLVADHFGTSAVKVERGIRNLVEVTWIRGDASARERYFGNTVNAERGKPTNAEFIARLANVLRQQVMDPNTPPN